MGKIMNKLQAMLHDRQKIRELTLYVVFGVLTTLVNWLVYFAVTRLLGMDRMEQDCAQYRLAANIGNVTAWVLAVLFAFFTNKKYVFQSDRGTKTGAWKEFWLFVSARVASLLIFDLALFNLLLWLGMNADWDKLLMNGLVIIFNYFASSLVIFKKKEKE